jgi:hypothetical protein
MSEFDLFSDVNFEQTGSSEELDLFAEELEDRENACASTFFTAGTPCSTLSTATTICSLINVCG